MAEDRKPKGWFSRRHETNKEHLEAKEARTNRRVNRPTQVWDDITRQWTKVYRRLSDGF